MTRRRRREPPRLSMLPANMLSNLMGRSTPNRPTSADNSRRSPGWFQLWLVSQSTYHSRTRTFLVYSTVSIYKFQHHFRLSVSRIVVRLSIDFSFLFFSFRYPCQRLRFLSRQMARPRATIAPPHQHVNSTSRQTTPHHGLFVAASNL